VNRPSLAVSGAGALGAALLCLLQLPVVAAHPSQAIWGATDADSLGLIWTLWHSAWHIFEQASLGVRSALILFPRGGALLPATPIESVLLSPLTRLLGPVPVFNLLQLLHVALAAGCTALLAERLTRRRSAALAVAPILALSPVLLATVRNGNLDAGQLFWLPLCGALAWWAARAERARGAVLAGAGLGLALVANVYVGIGALATAAILWLAARGPWRRGLLLLAVALVLAGPWLLYGAALLQDAGSVVEKSRSSVQRMRLQEGAAHLWGFLLPGLRPVSDPRGVLGGFANGWSMGWLAPLLALPRLWRADRLDRALWMLALVGLFLSLGPVLLLAGEPLLVAGRPLPLPYVFLDLLPPFSMLIELWRFSALLQLALALLAARSLARWRPRWAALAGCALVVEALLLHPGRAAWQQTSIPDEPVAELCRDLPAGAILSFPVRQGDWPLYYQTQHGRPVANSPMNAGDPVVFGLISRGEWSLAQLREAARGVGYRWLMLHTRPQTSAEQPMDEILGELEAAGLVSRRAGSLVLADLSADGPWPASMHRSRGLRDE